MKMLPNGKSYSKLLQYKPIERKKRNIFPASLLSLMKMTKWKMQIQDHKLGIQYILFATQYICRPSTFSIAFDMQKKNNMS